MNTLRGEISTIVILTTFAVLAVATLITTTLNREVQTTETQAAATACPFDSGVPVPLGKTESDASNAENRVPISQNRTLYDSLGNMSGFARVVDEGVLTLTKTDEGSVDSGVKNMMASMFGYKPKRLAAAFDPPDGGTYILEVPTDASHNEIKMPATGYDIGGGYEAMVVFAAADRVTLHIGRHEYFTGTKTCSNGKTCSGGYWIYIKGICVDQQIINAYNSTKGAQESAGTDLNPIDLPMVRAGQILGKATGNSVLVGVRDNGPFISIFKPDYWGGVSEVDILGGASPTATPVPAATITPNQTATPTPTTTSAANTPSPSPSPSRAAGASPTLTPTGYIGAPAIDSNIQYASYNITLTDDVILPACDGSGNYSACFKIDSNSI